MSFLYDPALLVGAGVAAGACLDDDKEDAATVGVTALFWSVSIPLWFNARWVDWFARMWGAESGREFMLNSGRVGLGLLTFDPAKTGIRRHLVAAALFLTYPLWFRLGWRIGSRLARHDSAPTRTHVPGSDETGEESDQQESASGPDTVTSTSVK